jgi:flagellar basal-body rod modification protein FlgD
VIRRDTTALGAAAGSWRWDGRDARGNQRPDGAYRVAVTGQAEDGTTVPLTAAVSGTVTGASRVEGALTLRLGAASIGFDRLRELPGG